MSKTYVIDRTLHWISALLLFVMLMYLSAQLHNVDWQIKGQLEHRQGAVETHAFIGIVLLLVTLARLFLPVLVNTPIKRIELKSSRHALIVKLTHIALYLCIFLLVATGLLMINNYEIPITLLSVELPPNKDMFYSFFPAVHEIHMILKQTLWILIALHFAGIMYAKR